MPRTTSLFPSRLRVYINELGEDNIFTTAGKTLCCEVRDTKVLVEKTYNIRHYSAVLSNKLILGGGNKKSLIPLGL